MFSIARMSAERVGVSRGSSEASVRLSATGIRRVRPNELLRDVALALTRPLSAGSLAAQFERSLRDMDETRSAALIRAAS